MKRLSIVLCLLLSMVSLLNVSVPLGVQAQDTSWTVPIISTKGDDLRVNSTSTSYLFTNLQHNAFLRSDGSAVIYIENVVQNWDYTPMDRHTWCFYWGSGVYSNVFARDSYKYLEVNYYEDYSYDYGLWGLCIESAFTHSIGIGEDYYYAVGVTIADHHDVSNDTLTARWRVSSDSSIVRYVDVASWPYNHRGFTAEPTPDDLGDDYALWERTDAEAPWEFTVSLTVALSDQMAVDPLSQGTTPYDGNDIAWENDPYGVNTPWNIGEQGCYLTAGTMAINYFAKVLGFSDRSITPGDLNDWLTEPVSEGSTVPQGYGSSGCPGGSYCLVNGWDFDSASAELFDTEDVNGVEQPLITRADEDINRVSDMRDNLQNGQLGILNVNNGGYGHFVLVTGYTTVSGIETVTINDPFESRGNTTLYEQYGNSFLDGVQWYSRGDATVRPNYVELSANCPVELLVTDEMGRRTGYDPRTGVEYNEIPSSSYVEVYHPHQRVDVDEPTKVLQIQAMDLSKFDLQVIGTDSGEYALDYYAELAYSEDQNLTFFGETAPGQVDEYTIQFDPNHGFLQKVYLPVVLN